MPIKVNALDHLVVNVTDAEKSAVWYERALGMTRQDFDPGGGYARWRQVTTTIATLSAITAILFLVLAKPVIEPTIAPEWARQPGGLQSLLETISPIP